jgi:hypothetical protein
MSSDTIIFLEFALTLGLVVGFGVWELRKLKRYKERDGQDR